MTSSREAWLRHEKHGCAAGRGWRTGRRRYGEEVGDGWEEVGKKLGERGGGEVEAE